MRVVFFYRCPSAGYYSIERIFNQMIGLMPASVKCDRFYSRHSNLSPWAFISNVVEAWRNRGEINHITGDIHYVDLLLRKNRTVLTIHDCICLDVYAGLKRRIIKWLWYDFPIRKCRFVTTVSSFTARQLVNFCPQAKGKIVVIHDPIDERFAPCPKAFSGTPVILHVGTTPNKNLERVAEALAGIDCILSIIGRLNAQQKATLERWGINYRNVYDLSDEELVAKYRESDIMLFASVYEGFGMPIIEAQATGRPVVTSDCASMPEIAGEAACLVNPFDVRSIRAGILKVIEDSEYRGDLIRAGYKNVKRFGPDSIANEYVKLYRMITGSETQNDQAL